MSTESDTTQQPLKAEEKAFRRLSEILDTLRQECPWDRAQTMKSLRYLTIEEVHELSEAIVAWENAENEQQKANLSTATSREALCQQLQKELGDIAMHILFYCKIAADRDLFDTADVYNAICDKLVSRHPFIYHQADYHGESWEQLKMREGRKGVLEGVPDSLPSLVKAVRMQEKVAGMLKGDPSASLAPAVRGTALDVSRLGALLPNETSEADFGELLFALVDWARSHGINADDALCRANQRFRQQYADC